VSFCAIFVRFIVYFIVHSAFVRIKLMMMMMMMTVMKPRRLWLVSRNGAGDNVATFALF